MPGTVGLLGVIAYNYSRHLRGLPTICATVRRLLPRTAANLLIDGIFTWLLDHIDSGYPTPDRPPRPRGSQR